MRLQQLVTIFFSLKKSVGHYSSNKLSSSFWTSGNPAVLLLRYRTVEFTSMQQQPTGFYCWDNWDFTPSRSPNS
jgi:hypothetical protein